MTSFMNVCFSSRVNLEQIEEKTAFGGPGARSTGKFFEILHGVLAFLVLFEQIVIKLFAPHSEFFTKHDAFCSHVFDLCVLTSGQEWI